MDDERVGIDAMDAARNRMAGRIDDVYYLAFINTVHRLVLADDQKAEFRRVYNAQLVKQMNRFADELANF